MTKKSSAIPACKHCQMTDWERQEVEEVTTTYLLDMNGIWRPMDVGPSFGEINFWCRSCHELLTSEKRASVLRNLPLDHFEPCEAGTVRAATGV